MSRNPLRLNPVSPGELIYFIKYLILMSILVNKDSRVIVQGFTGSEGTFHATQMIEYGTR